MPEKPPKNTKKKTHEHYGVFNKPKNTTKSMCVKEALRLYNNKLLYSN